MDLAAKMRYGLWVLVLFLANMDIIWIFHFNQYMLTSKRSVFYFQISQPFILDGSEGPPFALLARFVVLGDLSAVFIGFFVVALAIYLLPLIFFRMWHYLALGMCYIRQ